MPSPALPVLRYTSRESISYRLEQRLQIGGSTQSTIGKQVANPNLIDLVAFQVESKVTLRLSRLYRTPLTLSDPDTLRTISSCVEKLVLAEILPVVLVQSGDSTREGGLRFIMAREGQSELAMLVDGTVFLAGEAVQQVSDSVRRNDTATGKRGTITSRSRRGTTRLRPRTQPAETIVWDQGGCTGRPDEYGSVRPTDDPVGGDRSRRFDRGDAFNCDWW